MNVGECVCLCVDLKGVEMQQRLIERLYLAYDEKNKVSDIRALTVFKYSKHKESNREIEEEKRKLSDICNSAALPNRLKNFAKCMYI